MLDVRTGDLRDPIRSVVEAHAELAEQRGVSLSSEVPAAPVMLRFDRERIVQLLTNLVGNGLKFTQRGGEVVVSLADAPEGAILAVRDTGPGITAAELPHVFDRFYKADASRQGAAGGSGLGLSIVKAIVEEFEISPEQAREDLEAFLSELYEHGMLADSEQD